MAELSLRRGTDSGTTSKSSESRTFESVRPARRTKSSALDKIRHQLEHETSADQKLPADSPNEVQVVDKLKLRAVVVLERISAMNWNNKLAVPDLFADATDTRRSVKSQISRTVETCDEVNESSDEVGCGCSMTLAEKWGLRPVVVRLERIDVSNPVKLI